MARLFRVIFVLTLVFLVKANDELTDFEFSDSDEVMTAQESRQYQTVVKPPVFISKPTGVTNSHRPQYNLDSFEDRSDTIEEEVTTKRSLVKNYKSSNNIRSKESMVKDAVLRAMDRKDHVGKFAQVLPIIRAMSGNQRVALASLVANQVSTPPGRAPMNLAQVRSMFGNDSDTSGLMLPILLDMANLIRRAVRPGKETREVQMPYQPKAQFLRRSFTEDTESSDELVDDEVELTTTTKAPNNRDIYRLRYINRKPFADNNNETSLSNEVNTLKYKRNATRFSPTTTTEPATTPLSVSTSSLLKSRAANASSMADNTTLDLAAESTNMTISQDLPVAEKLRALGTSRFVDRKGAQLRRGIYTPSQPKPSPASSMSRRTTAEPAMTSIARRRPIPSRKLPTSTAADPNNCELFTNSLCLQSEDYPAEAIVQSIRRNKAAAAALLADYRDPEEGAVDGVTAAQEAKYTEQHYLVSNRRGDTANRDFASAGEAGFMCPSTVKYARPQRARATSGQWKYIVNTGEHTQTLRLEKCLKPKESCTYLTDNFKSKCVQVYNYHRLLTWDQQNGLHMDIFKVPTCCSCHIEGYSVSFPPLGQRMHETSSEHFPGEDLSAEQGNHALEDVQSTIQRPTFKSPPFTRNKPLESFPPFTDNQNLIGGSPFSKHVDNDDSLSSSNPVDSFGNTYFPDTFNQASSIRNVKRPSSSRNPTKSNLDSLPSFLEPPTPDATSSFNFVKDSTKYKLPGSQFKRTVRPSRRPIRKKLSSGPEDLLSSGTSAIEFSPTSAPNKDDTLEDDYDESETVHAISPPRVRATIAPKLPALTTEYEQRPVKDVSIINDNISPNGKRVNYNYHPIIDFFDEDKDPGGSPIDREDIEPSYMKAAESEWKPINVTPPANGKVTFVSTQRKLDKRSSK